ncbi:hypothetical protein GCM10028796_25200 [Ramlibacter monticola]
MFDSLFQRFQDVQSENVAARTLKDRVEQILWWRSVAIGMANDDTLPESFSGALHLAYQRSGLTRAALCRASGICMGTLKRWFAGDGLPEHDSLHAVRALEKVLDVRPDTLICRIPARRLRGSERREDAKRPTTTFGERMRRNREGLAKFALEPTERLFAQWQQLIAIKVDFSRDDATPRNTWRLKPASRVSIDIDRSAVFDGQVCPSAALHFQLVRCFLGYLATPRKYGGQELPAAGLDTLAWLVRDDLIKRYVKWIQNRSDGILHSGVLTALNNLRSHLRPKTGAVWLMTDLAQTLPAEGRPEAACDYDSATAWQARCEAAYRVLLDHQKKLQEQSKGEKSRNPKETMGSLIRQESPMLELVRIISAIENQPPPAHHKRSYAAWLRDLLLLKMLQRHPLRGHHFAIMTFRGSAANLRRAGSGWELDFPLSDFKNEKSSSAMPYTVTLHPTLNVWVNRYLNEARPLLKHSSASHRVFLPSVSRRKSLPVEVPEEAWGFTSAGIYHCIKTRTAPYTESGIGLSTHSFRHIAATDHLKRNPREYALVALILNDSLPTVLKEYDYMEAQDGVRALENNIEDAEEQYRSMSSRPNGIAASADNAG